jgi:serine/threonine protein kinase
MEFMPIGTLKNSIYWMKIDSWKVRKQILLDICEGGAFLHDSFYSNGKPKRVVLHQDIKSANVLLCMENGELRAKTADFGLAFIKNLSSEMSASKSVKHNGGTTVYKAPELFVINAKFTKVRSCLIMVEMRSIRYRNHFSRGNNTAWPQRTL